MKKKNVWSMIGVVLLASSLTAACSKKLMPPEIEAEGTLEEPSPQEVAYADPVVEEPPMVAEAPAEEPIEINPSEFLTEEDVNVAEAPAEATPLGEIPGNGSDGAFGLDTYGNPAAGSGGAGTLAEGAPSTTPNAGDNLLEEARMFKFKSTAELKDVHFRFDKYDLDEQSRSVLIQNADFLKQNPLVKVEIQGHCDERGTNNYNLALGHRRAVSTKKFLMAQGIDETRLRVISYGEEKPFCGESNENCWWRNRRAHFMVAK